MGTEVLASSQRDASQRGGGIGVSHGDGGIGVKKHTCFRNYFITISKIRCVIFIYLPALIASCYLFGTSTFFNGAFNNAIRINPAIAAIDAIMNAGCIKVKSTVTLVTPSTTVFTFARFL